MKEQLEKIIPTREDFEQWVEEEKDKALHPYLVMPINFKESHDPKIKQGRDLLSVWGSYMAIEYRKLQDCDVDPESIIFEVVLSYVSTHRIQDRVAALLRSPDSERFLTCQDTNWINHVLILTPSEAHNSKDVYEKTRRVMAEDNHRMRHYDYLIDGFGIYARNALRVIVEPSLESESRIDESQLREPTINPEVSL